MTTYDATTALVIVDVQNDFADPKGSLYVLDGADIIPPDARRRSPRSRAG